MKATALGAELCFSFLFQPQLDSSCKQSNIHSGYAAKILPTQHRNEELSFKELAVGSFYSPTGDAVKIRQGTVMLDQLLSHKKMHSYQLCFFVLQTSASLKVLDTLLLP